MAYTSKLIGSGFRSIQVALFNRINNLEQELKDVYKERLENLYNMECALKQEGLNSKLWHGDKIYILNPEGQDMYDGLHCNPTVSNLELLETVLSYPELFIVINYDKQYVDYVDKNKE